MSSESEMTKETSSGSTPLSVFYRYPRLMLGVSLMGGLGLLTSSLVVAQTDSPPIDTLAAPTTPPVAPPVEAAPYSPPSPPTAKPKPTAPESIVVPAARVRKPVAPPAPFSAKKPAVRARRPQASAPVIVVPKKPALAAPNLSVPAPSLIAKPPKVILNPAAIQESARTPIEPTNRYIDRTDYSVGATRNYDAPDRVLMSERSTGCQTVSQNGRLARGVCGVAAQNRQTANSQKVANSSNRQQVANSINQLITNSSNSQQVANSSNSQQTANSTKNQLITNSRQLLAPPQLGGVTRLPTPSVAVVQPIRVGLVKVSNRGIRPTRHTPFSVASNYSGGSSSTPTGLAYYNLTTRPTDLPNVGKGSFMFPLTIPTAITSAFGWRVHPITGDRRFHAGTDLGAPQGTPVIAAATGQVVTADFLGGYGLTVILHHEKGTQESLYAHLSEIFVQPGDDVEQGTVIGRVGSTGNSTGPHLHFEWRHLTPDGWVAVDAGAHLEYSLAQFIRALQLAQATSQRGT